MFFNVGTWLNIEKKFFSIGIGTEKFIWTISVTGSLYHLNDPLLITLLHRNQFLNVKVLVVQNNKLLSNYSSNDETYITR